MRPATEPQPEGGSVENSGAWLPFSFEFQVSSLETLLVSFEFRVSKPLGLLMFALIMSYLEGPGLKPDSYLSLPPGSPARRVPSWLKAMTYRAGAPTSGLP